MLSLGLGQGRCLDLVDQATLAVRALVPGIHLVELLVALVNHQHRALDARGQVRASHDDGDFKQALFFGVEASHLAIEPDQVLVRLGKAVRGRGRGVRHGVIVADRGRPFDGSLQSSP